MDALLKNRSWLAGDYSYADIAFYMAALFGERQGAPVTGATPHLVAWRERMSARPAVRTVAGAMGRWLASVGRPVPAFMRALG
jgi:glutathione S-transferase